MGRLFATALVTRDWKHDAGWLAVIVVIALAIRIQGPWSLVFTPTHVNYLETDAWYHIRVIENLVSQFPFRLRFDPYASPAGQFIPVAPLFDFVIAGTAWIVGLGHPSTALVTRVAVFTPPVLAAVTIGLAHFVARASAGSLAGLLAAAMAAILPGHFLDRSLLGYVDHHVLEACLSTAVLYTLARALTKDRASPIRDGVSMGAAIAAYWFTWTSAAFLVAILAVWFALHVVLHSRRGGIGTIPRTLMAASSLALVFVVAARPLEPYRSGLMIAALLILLALAAATEAGRWLVRAGWCSPYVVVASGLGIAAAALPLLALLAPDIVPAVRVDLSRFTATTAGQVIEGRPLFLLEGVWSLRPAWTLFGTGFIVGLVAIGALGIRWVRRREPIDLLLIVWTTAMYAATLGQNRFGYYLVPATAIAGGCVAARLIDAGRRAGEWPRRGAVVLVAGLIFGPNLVPAIWTTGRPAGLPAEWFPAFTWLREHSPEPFGDAEYYYARYAEPIRRPSSSVLVWWDYGYWTITEAHRVPTSIPTQGGARETGEFFLESDEGRARAMLERLLVHDVFVDERLAFHVDPASRILGKFESLVLWAGADPGRFYATFLFPQNGGFRTAFLYFPDYYRSMAFRLGVMGGEGLPSPGRSAVVSWRLQEFAGQGTFRVVTDVRDFSNYPEAAAYLTTLGPGNHAVVGTRPEISPVPVEPIREFTQVYRTPAPGVFARGAVQIFQLRPNP